MFENNLKLKIEITNIYAVEAKNKDISNSKAERNRRNSSPSSINKKADNSSRIELNRNINNKRLSVPVIDNKKKQDLYNAIEAANNLNYSDKANPTLASQTNNKLKEKIDRVEKKLNSNSKIMNINNIKNNNNSGNWNSHELSSFLSTKNNNDTKHIANKTNNHTNNFNNSNASSNKQNKHIIQRSRKSTSEDKFKNANKRNSLFNKNTNIIDSNDNRRNTISASKHIILLNDDKRVSFNNTGSNKKKRSESSSSKYNKNEESNKNSKYSPTINSSYNKNRKTAATKIDYSNFIVVMEYKDYKKAKELSKKTKFELDIFDYKTGGITAKVSLLFLGTIIKQGKLIITKTNIFKQEKQFYKEIELKTMSNISPRKCKIKQIDFNEYSIIIKVLISIDYSNFKITNLKPKMSHINIPKHSSNSNTNKNKNKKDINLILPVDESFEIAENDNINDNERQLGLSTTTLNNLIKVDDIKNEDNLDISYISLSDVILQKENDYVCNFSNDIHKTEMSLNKFSKIYIEGIKKRKEGNIGVGNDNNFVGMSNKDGSSRFLKTIDIEGDEKDKKNNLHVAFHTSNNDGGGGSTLVSNKAYNSFLKFNSKLGNKINNIGNSNIKDNANIDRDVINEESKENTIINNNTLLSSNRGTKKKSVRKSIVKNNNNTTISKNNTKNNSKNTSIKTLIDLNITNTSKKSKTNIEKKNQSLQQINKIEQVPKDYLFFYFNSLCEIYKSYSHHYNLGLKQYSLLYKDFSKYKKYKELFSYKLKRLKIKILQNKFKKNSLVTQKRTFRFLKDCCEVTKEDITLNKQVFGFNYNKEDVNKCSNWKKEEAEIVMKCFKNSILSRYDMKKLDLKKRNFVAEFIEKSKIKVYDGLSNNSKNENNVKIIIEENSGVNSVEEGCLETNNYNSTKDYNRKNVNCVGNSKDNQADKNNNICSINNVNSPHKKTPQNTCSSSSLNKKDSQEKEKFVEYEKGVIVKDVDKILERQLSNYFKGKKGMKISVLKNIKGEYKIGSNRLLIKQEPKSGVIKLSIGADYEPVDQFLNKFLSREEYRNVYIKGKQSLTSNKNIPAIRINSQDISGT